MDKTSDTSQDVAVVVDTIDILRDSDADYRTLDLFVDLDALNKDYHINSRLHGLYKSATLEINEKSSDLEAEGKKVYRFGLGQSPFPVPRHVIESLKQNASQKDYLPVKGLYQLRKAVAESYNRRDGTTFKAENVLIGPGSKELLFLLQMIFTGDLLVASPCWVSYIPQAIILGKQVRLLHTEYDTRWRVTAAQLENLCEQDKINRYKKPKLLVLNYPDNPSGQTYTPEELQKLAKVARKYKVLILSDEIYGEIDYSGNHCTIAKYYPEGTIISSGLSKWAGAGGWRLGTFTFPNNLWWLLDAMAIVASETYTSVSAPIQFAAVTAFQENGEIQEYLMNSRRILDALGEWIYQTLDSVDVKLHRPSGGFYIFGDLEAYRTKLLTKNITSSRGMVDLILEETGVAILPGLDFARPKDELTFRLAFVNFNGEVALNAARTVYRNKIIDYQFLEEFCADSVNGILALVEWLKNL